MRYKHFPVFLLLSILLVLSVQKTNAQRCATDDLEKLIRKQNHNYPSREAFEQWMESRLLMKAFGTRSTTDPDTIPIVIHILHNVEDLTGEGSNISDEQIYSQIEVLNEDFNRKNADTVNTRALFADCASRLNIFFTLAKRDPEGLPTNGIVRKPSKKLTYTYNDQVQIATESYWPPDDYLNLWVIDIASNTYGWATFPEIDMGSGVRIGDFGTAAVDGVFIDYKAFGSIEKYPKAELHHNLNRGRTCTHEIGHFFGLRHVWGDVEFSCIGDDYVEDTPDSNKDYDGECPENGYSCDSEDMFENYMYYTNDKCMNIYTADQVARMDQVLKYAPRRASLLESNGDMPVFEDIFDLAIVKVKDPGLITCSNLIAPVVTVLNQGNVDVASFTLQQILDGRYEQKITMNDTIRSGEYMDITFSPSTLRNGAHVVEFEFRNLVEDEDVSNNHLSHKFTSDDHHDIIPSIEKFEQESLSLTDWITINQDNDIGWEITDAPGARSDNSAAFINLYQYKSINALDWLISPSLDFSEATEASMRLFTSYAKNEEYNDRLIIKASDNCGYSFDYTLEILSAYELSSTTSIEDWAPESWIDWEKYTIDLGNLVGKEHVRIAFIAVNDNGNNLYVDDVEFYTTSAEHIVNTGENSFTVYPNPTFDGRFRLAINTDERQDVVVVVYDGAGHKVVSDHFSNTLNQTYEYDFSSRPSGIYFFRVIGETFIRSKKLIISR